MRVGRVRKGGKEKGGGEEKGFLTFHFGISCFPTDCFRA